MRKSHGWPGGKLIPGPLEKTKLGYAKKFFQLPRLKEKHRPAGSTNRTPPALNGDQFINYNDRLRRHKIGVRADGLEGLTLIHVNGYPVNSFNNTLNREQTLSDQVWNFIRNAHEATGNPIAARFVSVYC